MLAVKVSLCLSVLCVLSFCFAQPRTEIDSRIFRGMNATKGQFPYFAQVLTNATVENATQPDYIFCGGSIIGSKYILTAAHCVENFTKVIVTLGVYDAMDASTQQLYVAEQIYVHDDYNLTSGTNDIAIIQLRHEIDFNELIKPIPLSCEITGSGVWTRVTGRGKTHTNATSFPEILQWTNMLTIPNEICSKAYPRVDISAAKICTYGKYQQATCLGDSGSVLMRVFNGTEAQIGVVNGGSSRGCDHGQIGINSRISHYIDWIERMSGVKCVKFSS